MPYAPQPGTIPHRAIAWLRSMASLYPDREHSTPDLCAGLDIESVGFSAYMGPARAHGIVKATQKPGSKVLYWSIGDGEPVDLHAPRDEPLPHRTPEPEIKPGPFLPGATSMAIGFRALAWDGNLLVTGMEIRDGVAVFTPDQVQQLKQHTDWWRTA